MLTALETELRSIAHHYPRLLWFLTVRRIPLAVFYQEDFNRSWVVQLKRHLEVVGLKYGNDATKGVQFESGKLSLHLSGKFLSSLARLIGVGSCYQQLLQLSGLLISGAEIKLVQNRIEFKLTEDQKYLKTLHEQRLHRRPPQYQLSETVGLFSALEIYAPTAIGIDNPPFILSTRVADIDVPSMLLTHRLGSYSVSLPSFIPGLLSLKAFSEDLRVFEVTLVDRFKLTAAEVVGFLWAVSLHVVQKQERTLEACLDFAVSGMDLLALGGDATELMAWLMLCCEKLGISVEGEKGCIFLGNLIDHFIDKFGFHAELAGQLRIDDPGHGWLVYALGGCLVFDFHGLLTWLRDLYQELDTKQVGQPKALHAERQIAQRLAAVPKTRIVFDCPFKFRREGNVILEVDSNIQLGNVLFLVEVKAYAFRPRREDSIKRVWNRWVDITSWLRDRDLKAQRLAASRRGDNYQIPDDVQYVAAVVCTPFIHHIYSTDEKFFLSPDVPRVCTPEEFILFLGNGLPPHIYSRSWCLRIVD